MKHALVAALACLASACASSGICDGIVGEGEECDDGNQDPADGCDCVAHPPWLAPLGGLEDDGFVVIEDDGAWCWFQDERAIMLGNRLAVASVTHGGDTQVSSFDLQTGAREHGMLHRSLERDDHDVASMLRLPDDRVIAFYTRHDGFSEMRWRISQSSALDVWGPEERFRVEHQVTYSNPFLLSSRLHVFFRGLHANPTIATSDDDGETWTSPRQLIDSHTNGTLQRVDQRPYVKYAADPDGAIHLFYTEGHPSEFGATSIYHLVYRDGRLIRSDGTDVASDLPVAPSRGTRIHDGPTDGTAWPWDAAIDAAGNPTVVYSVTDATGQHSYHYAWWDGATWTASTIGFGGSALYEAEPFYAGGITIDPDHPNVVYLSANVDPRTGAGPLGHYEIYRATTPDRGATWSIAPVTTGSTVDNLRPIVPIDHPAATTVVWMQGTYHSYIDYNTRIVGLVGGPDAAVRTRAPLAAPAAARFDLTGEGRAGYTPIAIDGSTASATEGDIELSITNVVSIPEHPIAGRGCTRQRALGIRLTGLVEDARYLLRLQSIDTKRHYMSPMRWYYAEGTTDDYELGYRGFYGAHRRTTSRDGGDSYVDIAVKEPLGRFPLVGTGFCTGGDATAFVDAIEVYPLPATTPVARIDVDRTIGPRHAHEATSLQILSGAMQASAAEGGITVTVTTDQIDTRPPTGPYIGSALGSEAVVAHDSLAVDVAGLTIGATYVITVYAAEHERYLHSASRWRLDEPGRDPRVVRAMHVNARVGTASKFTFIHTAAAPAFRLRATDVLYTLSTDPSVVLFSGLEIERAR